MEESPPLILCLENTNGEEVALKIEQHDTFKMFLDKAKSLLGYDVDINSITGNQPVSLEESAYTFLLSAEQNLPDSSNEPTYETYPTNPDDMVYMLDDGTQIRASQIQFDNEDPLTDLTAENIPFIKYTDSVDEIEPNNFIDYTVKDVNIVESPVNRISSPKCNFVNSLPFKLVCSNISNFEAQFTKYLESSTKMYMTDSGDRKTTNINYNNYNNSVQVSKNFYSREDILNMFKDTPVTPLPCDDNKSFEKRRHVRKTDPSRLVYKNWNAKPVIDLNSIDRQDCFICGKTVESNEKLYLFDKEDQILHRCESKKYMTQLKIICEHCLGENFKPSRMKSPSQSLNSDEYLVIKNNQQYIFQKTTSIDLKNTFFNYKAVDNMESRNNGVFVKVEIGPDGEIITKPVSDIKDDANDEKNDSSSDVEIIEPEPDIEVDLEDEHFKEFLGKYQYDNNIETKELKCRFCNLEFKELSEITDHAGVHKHDIEDGTVYPCVLCDYGYINLKWLKGHLEVAHGNKKEDIENNGEYTPHSSPVAKRTRSAIKKTDIKSDSDKKDNEDSEEITANDTQIEETEPPMFTTEVKQECLDSSDDSIWIVQTGDDDATEQLEKLLKVNEDVTSNNLKKHKCFNCSQIFPSAETLKCHKCRKRRRKHQTLAKDESIVYVPSEEDFIKRAQGRPRLLEDSGDNDLLIVRGRKKKNKDQTDSQIVTCHNCNESFTSKVRLKFHMQFHDTTNLMTSDGQYLCTECDDTKFPTETELFDHVHFQHDKQKRWQCPIKDCGKTFFLRATLTKHSRTHTDTRRYVCVTCGKRFLDKQTLDEHGVTHLQIKPFQCHICLKQLTRRSRLRMHLRAHEEELSPALVLICTICSRAFRDENDAQEHANKSMDCVEEFTKELKEESENTEQLSPTSGIVRPVVKAIDDLRLTKGVDREVNNDQSEALLSALDDAARSIIRVVNIEKAFRCEYCEDVFYIEDALNNHRAIHKGVKNPFTCHICKVSFATYSRCTTHKTTHGFYKSSTAEGRNEGSKGPASAGILGYGGFPVVKHFLCEDCGRSYLHWTYLQVHRRMKHANENYIFKCNQCEMTFPNSWSVTYHRKKIHGKSGQDDNGGFTKIVRENYRIPCRDCDAILPNKTELYKHRKKEHCDESLQMDRDDSQTTICGQCGHNLHNVIALQKHIKEVHGPRSHSCPVCARSFRSASVRDEHVRVHTGERPYPCDVCGVAFRRSTAMRNHRLIHTGVRAWACTRCPKRFRIKSDLRAHLRLKHPAHLVVIEIEGTTCSTEEVLQHLAVNNIQQDKVIEVTMISFAKDTINIVPNSSRALSLLSDMPKTQLLFEKLPEQSDIYQETRRGRGIAKTQKPTILRNDQEYNVTMNVDNDNLSNVDVQLLLQDGGLVNGAEMVQLHLDDRSFLG